MGQARGPQTVTPIYHISGMHGDLKKGQEAHKQGFARLRKNKKKANHLNLSNAFEIFSEIVSFNCFSIVLISTNLISGLDIC